MNHFFQTTLCSSLLFTCTLSKAGQYDALPLRSALSNEPHFQTSQGREGHRFEGAEINKYRLYDFYKRQAEYHLAQEKPTDLLLPYPGLEGGRRGHWGNTNEKLSSAILKREKEPKYDRLMNRSVHGDTYVCSSHENTQSVSVFAKSSPFLWKVILDASMKAPVHAFSYKVDRFGFDMRASGRDYLVNNGAEWHDSKGKPLAVAKDGYHLYKDKVIFRRLINHVPVLDMPTVSYNGSTAVYTRAFEWNKDVADQKFALPLVAQKFNNPKVTISKSKDAVTAVISDGARQLTHRITCSEKDKVSLSNEGGRIWVTIHSLKKGASVEMSSWITKVGEKQPTFASGDPIKLSTMLKGGARFYTKDVAVKGILDADPAAKGTAYTFDEIPVPSENPYGMPMTTCGISFGEDGAAYIPTLVGDVWKVTGLDASLANVKWQRYATGLNSPLGIEMVDGVLHVLTQHQILKLYDFNNDGEADLVRPLTKRGFPGGRLHNLERDAKGNFFSSHVNGIHRISDDGSRINVVSGRSRNPLGLAVRADGLALSDSSEGNQSNGTCTIYEPKHPENQNTVAKGRRILYLPRGIDNSPGSRIFMNSTKFGALGKSLFGVSYGSGRIYQLMRDPNNGSPQAALRMLPGEFSSGSARLAMNPSDEQLYVVGFDGWGDFGVTEGNFTRVRYTGKKDLTPVSWQSYSDGLCVKFNEPIDPTSITAKSLFIQQWNYRDSLHSYGSPEYSVKDGEKLGHDRLKIESITFSKDGTEMLIKAPGILPAMCTQIYAKLKSTSGAELTLDLYATINQLPKKSLKGEATVSTKPHDLKVPYKDNNKNTYVTITNFFDKRAGKDLVKRKVGPIVPYKKKDLNYNWIHSNIIIKQSCIACHTSNAKYDFSNYESLLKAIDLKHPHKSHILGMMASESMPPIGFPTVSPEMQKALKEWIEMGAPK